MSHSETARSNVVDILLVGLGSIGTVYGYMLEKSGKARVTAVARSNYQLYHTTGIELKSDRFGTIANWKPYRVFKSQAEALADGTQYAICILCTKCLPDVTSNATILADSIASSQIGAYSLIQNGISVEDDLYEAVAASNVPIISSLAWIGINTTPDGSVVRWRGVDTICSGIYPPKSDVRELNQREVGSLDLWISLLNAGGAHTHTTDNVVSVRYAKNVLNCTWASLQGLIRTQQAYFAQLGPEHHDQIKKFMREIITVGFASGLLYEGMVVYPALVKAQGIEDTIESDFKKFVMAPLRTMGGHKWSLFLDIEQGRPFEVEVIIGGVLKIARKHGVETPLLDFVYTLLKAVQVSIIAEQKAKKAATG